MGRYRPGHKKDSWESIRRFALGEEQPPSAVRETANPRVAAFLREHDLCAQDIARRSGEDLPVLALYGTRLPWTVHYTQWLRRMGLRYAQEHWRARPEGVSESEWTHYALVDPGFEPWLETIAARRWRDAE